MPERQITQRQLARLKEIKTFIHTWRTNEGLSQNGFADLADIHSRTIFNIERNHTVHSIHSINVLTLFNCIDAMGMSLSEFFSGME
jgi:transcriptional regulator with XRE-family HTH domain